MKPFIPVLIVNFNGIDDTIAAVNSCIQQQGASTFVWILDNASDNLEGEMLQAHFAENTLVKVLLSAENLGFGKACNLLFQKALAHSNFDFVALLNNDAIADKNWLQELYKAAMEENADMVSSKMIQMALPHLMDNAGHLFLNTAEVVPKAYDLPEKNFTGRFVNAGACGGAALYSAQMLKEIGFFDPYFFVGYEDAELGLRGMLCGYKSVFEPRAVVQHKMGASIKKVFNYHYSLGIQKDIFYTYLKLMPLPFLLLNLPFFLFKYGAVWLMNLVFFRWKFFKVLSVATWHTVYGERKSWQKARTQFYGTHGKRVISTWAIWKQSTFFLWYDMGRFWKYIILRNKMQFEKY
jgi:GT2 family glycosyltransferase